MYLTKSITLSDGRTAVIRKLAWTQLKAAAKAQNTENVQAMRELGPELIRAFRSDDSAKGAKSVVDKIEDIQKAQARKASTYDQLQILLDGVSSFEGQEQAVAGGESTTRELDVQFLDPVAAEELHEAIVAYAWEVPGKNA